jgi:DnaJ-class molecular chaperone
MRCERCQGLGNLPINFTFGDYHATTLMPCPDCGGCGVAHCCDGLTAANETPEPEPPAE